MVNVFSRLAGGVVISQHHMSNPLSPVHSLACERLHSRETIELKSVQNQWKLKQKLLSICVFIWDHHYSILAPVKYLKTEITITIFLSGIGDHRSWADQYEAEVPVSVWFWTCGRFYLLVRPVFSRSQLVCPLFIFLYFDLYWGGMQVSDWPHWQWQ